MKHFILDFETMGTNTSDCAIIDCSVLIFDWDRFTSNDPYTLDSIGEVLKLKLSIKDQVTNYGYKVYENTIHFWEQQPKEVRAMIAPKKTDLTVSEFTKKFIDYLIPAGKINYWWSRSNSFDPILLWRLFESQNQLGTILEYLPHHKLRDTRTYIDAKFDFPKINGFMPLSDEELWNSSFKHHNSSWDILADVLRLQAIVRAENDLKQI